MKTAIIRILYELGEKAVDHKGLVGCVCYFSRNWSFFTLPSSVDALGVVIDCALIKGGDHNQNQRVQSYQGMEEPTNSPRALRHSRSVEANPLLIQAQGLMYQHVLHTPRRSPLSTSGQVCWDLQHGTRMFIVTCPYGATPVHMVHCSGD